MKKIKTKVQQVKLAMRIERKLRTWLFFNLGYMVDMYIGDKATSIYVYSQSDDYLTSMCVETIVDVIKPFWRAYRFQVFYGVTLYKKKNTAAVRVCIISE